MFSRRMGCIRGKSRSLANGGVVTTSGLYTIHTFLTSSVLTIVNPSLVDFLIVAGGGGGGTGGGGAGGMIIATGYSFQPGDLTVTIGTGGAGSTFQTASTSDFGYNGGDSLLDTLRAIGGGGGGCRGVSGLGKNGGSSGGCGSFYTAASKGLALQTSGAGYIGYGNQGWANTANSAWSCGGGGAGAPSIIANTTGSPGGAGRYCDFSGVNTPYAGGGGGSRYGDSTNTNLYGGVGGGGNGANTVTLAGAGVPNTGGGGGGGSSVKPGQPGGSGIIIVRYLTLG
jgi:hypothetical protein